MIDIYQNPEEFLTPLHTVDLANVERANEVAQTYLKEINRKNFLALESALALLWYNHFTYSPEAAESLSPSSPAEKYTHSSIGEHMVRLEIISKSLIEQELNAAHPTDPRVPLSFEIEVPNKPFVPNTSRSLKDRNYTELFRLLGFPSNKDSAWIDDDFISWEFSTRLAYSWYTQYILASELVRGNFVPSLLVGYNGPAIKELLSDNLISFHINLGTGINTVPYARPGNITDQLLFSSAMAIAYSSPTRLQYRSTQENFYRTKHGDKNNKYPAGGNNRLELVGLELQTIFDLQTLLHQAQNIGSALNAAVLFLHPHLAGEWHNTRDQLLRVFKGYNFPFYPSMLSYDAPRTPTQAKTDLQEVLFSSSASIEDLLINEYGAIPFSSVP